MNSDDKECPRIPERKKPGKKPPRIKSISFSTKRRKKEDNFVK